VRLDAIRAAGAEPYLGDPDRIMTLMDALAGTTILCWLMGTATGDNVADVHGGRLRMMCEKIVDTPVRGVLYEGSGSVAPELLQEGEMIVRGARATWNIPVEILGSAPATWLPDAVAAIDRLLVGR
jgi:hypothetical protein